MVEMLAGQKDETPVGNLVASMVLSLVGNLAGEMAVKRVVWTV